MDSSFEHKLRLLADRIASSPHNLVSRAERPVVYERHVLDCVAYAAAMPIETGQRWADIGTGGGLPGLVLATVRPDVQWLLVDSVRKKAAVVEELAADLALLNVTVAAERAETLAQQHTYREQFDGAISRAVAALPALAELLAGFVRVGGHLVAVKGPQWREEHAAALPAMSALALEDAGAVHIPAARPTWLVMMRRTGPLPRAYPRRPGLPQSQPLGGS